MMNDYAPRGTHALADGFDADPIALNNVKFLRATLCEEIEKIGASILNVVEYAFQPQGCTVVAVLGESHASVHTYPEHGVYMVDVFTCGDLPAAIAAERLGQRIGGRFVLRVLERGQKKTPAKNAGAVVSEGAAIS